MTQPVPSDPRPAPMRLTHVVGLFLFVGLLAGLGSRFVFRPLVGPVVSRYVVFAIIFFVQGYVMRPPSLLSGRGGSLWSRQRLALGLVTACICVGVLYLLDQIWP